MQAHATVSLKKIFGFLQKSSRKFRQNIPMRYILSFFLILVSITSSAQLTKKAKDSLPPIHIKTVPPNYYTTKLGFVCKHELKFQQALGINLFFRLGTKEYVDYLEQKPNTGKKF